MGQPIQRPDIGAALQRYLGLVGRVRPELEEFVLPVIAVGDITQGSAPDRSMKSIASGFQAGVVGQFFTLRFEIPGNILAVIDEIRFQVGAAASFRASFSAAGAALANTAAKQLQDGRLIDQGFEPAGVVTFGTQAGAIAPENFIGRANGTDDLVIQPRNMVIGSGRPNQFGFLELQCTTANLSVTWGLSWVEHLIL